jgi:hypothetical protein
MVVQHGWRNKAVFAEAEIADELGTVTDRPHPMSRRRHRPIRAQRALAGMASA